MIPFLDNAPPRGAEAGDFAGQELGRYSRNAEILSIDTKQVFIRVRKYRKLVLRTSTTKLSEIKRQKLPDARSGSVVLLCTF